MGHFEGGVCFKPKFVTSFLRNLVTAKKRWCPQNIPMVEFDLTTGQSCV